MKQPSVKDVGVMGEEDFFEAISLFSIRKEEFMERVRSTLKVEDREAFEQAYSLANDITVFLEILEGNPSGKVKVQSLLFLVFPTLRNVFLDDIVFILNFNGDKSIVINNELFLDLSKLFTIAFSLEDIVGKSKFNPVNDRAKDIADKIEKRRNIVAKEKGLHGQKVSTLATSASIVSTADGVPLTAVYEYTLPQLVSQFERARLYVDFKSQITLGAFAGLKDVEIADWNKSI